MYDVIVIGMGVAGISSAIYLKRAGKKVLLLEKDIPGGVINYIDNIENYPGFKSISGPDLAMNLFDSVKNLKIEYKFENVSDIILDKVKTIKTESGIYQAKNVIIATGRSPKLLGLAGEKELIGKGISTCALCDGALYKNKDVAVVGGGSSALSESLYLSKIVNKVYLIHRRDEFRGEKILIDEVRKTRNIELILNNEIKELEIEEDKLKKIILKDNRKIDISCLFLYIGFVPNTAFLEKTGLKLEDGYILVNDSYETNIDGVYAVGDVIKKEIYQIITAASEGAIAAIKITKEQ